MTLDFEQRKYHIMVNIYWLFEDRIARKLEECSRGAFSLSEMSTRFEKDVNEPTEIDIVSNLIEFQIDTHELVDTINTVKKLVELVNTSKNIAELFKLISDSPISWDIFDNVQYGTVPQVLIDTILRAYSESSSEVSQ